MMPGLRFPQTQTKQRIKHTLIDAVPAGPPGPAGEVSQQDLVNERMNHAKNPTSVAQLFLMVSDPPTQAEVQELVTRFNELLTALQRQP